MRRFTRLGAYKKIVFSPGELTFLVYYEDTPPALWQLDGERIAGLDRHPATGSLSEHIPYCA